MGGPVANPTYEAVCTGTTGHAEVVQVKFDPVTITFREILEVFFAVHNPTTLNLQGNDAGTQYRSAIFWHTPEQQRVAGEVVAAIDGKVWDDPIVTQLVPAETFYPAEEYHQEFFRRNPHQGYCMAVVSPKLNKFRKNFLSKLKK
jgi:peptide-methionine (S)-S-oxide reductase